MKEEPIQRTSQQPWLSPRGHNTLQPVVIGTLSLQVVALAAYDLYAVSYVDNKTGGGSDILATGRNGHACRELVMCIAGYIDGTQFMLYAINQLEYIVKCRGTGCSFEFMRDMLRRWRTDPTVGNGAVLDDVMKVMPVIHRPAGGESGPLYALKVCSPKLPAASLNNLMFGSQGFYCVGNDWLKSACQRSAAYPEHAELIRQMSAEPYKYEVTVLC